MESVPHCKNCNAPVGDHLWPSGNCPGVWPVTRFDPQPEGARVECRACPMVTWMPPEELTQMGWLKLYGAAGFLCPSCSKIAGRKDWPTYQAPAPPPLVHQCTICQKPIEGGVMVGDGDGAGVSWSHHACWWEKRERINQRYVSHGQGSPPVTLTPAVGSETGPHAAAETLRTCERLIRQASVQELGPHRHWAEHRSILAEWLVIIRTVRQDLESIVDAEVPSNG